MSESQPCPSGAPIARFALSLSYSDLAFVKSAMSTADTKAITEFEEAFAKRLGLARAFFISSARVGMYLTLKALDLPERSRILMPSWTHPSMPAMVVAAGHLPRIADISPGTWTMGPENLSEADWQGVAAVVITHMYGCPAPAAALAAEAERRHVLVLEDCAQGLGAQAEERPCGGTGMASFYSFAVTKNFTTLSGGMIGVRDEQIARKLEAYLGEAKVTPNQAVWPTLLKATAIKTATTKLGFSLGVYPPLAVGWAFSGRDMLHSAFEEEFTVFPPSEITRPAPVQAALGLRMLAKLDAHNAQRNKNGTTLLHLLEKKHLTGLTLPKLPDFGKHIFMSFVVAHAKRERIARLLFSKRIDTSPGYLKPVNLVSILQGTASHVTPLTVAQELGQRQLHLPIYPDLNSEQLTRLAESLAWAVNAAEEDS